MEGQANALCLDAFNPFLFRVPAAFRITHAQAGMILSEHGTTLLRDEHRLWRGFVLPCVGA